MKPVFKVTLALAILGVSLLTGCSRFGAGAKTLATVNGQRMTQRDLDTRLNVYRLTYGSQFDPQANRDKVLQQMVDETVLLQEANRRKLKADVQATSQERSKFQDYLVFQAAQQSGLSPHPETGNPDRTKAEAALKESMKKSGVTQRDLDQFITDLLTIRKLVDQVVQPVTVTDAEVRTYYQSHPQEFTVPDQVRASHILVKSEDEARRISQEARAPGADFASLAKKYSTDPGTKDKGGDLGYFSEGDMMKEFSDAAFALKTGEVSNPVKTTYGWHVIKSFGHRSGLLPLETVQDKARQQTLGQKQSDTFNKMLADLKAAAQITPPELAKAQG